MYTDGSLTFSAGKQMVFTGRQNFLKLTFFNKKNFLLDGQTRQAQSSQLVNLPCATPSETSDIHVVSCTLCVPAVKHCLDLSQNITNITCCTEVYSADVTCSCISLLCEKYLTLKYFKY